MRAQAEKIPMLSRSHNAEPTVGDMLSWRIVHGLSDLAISGSFSRAVPDQIDGQLGVLTRVMAAMGLASERWLNPFELTFAWLGETD